jgi:hypothetical protein
MDGAFILPSDLVVLLSELTFSGSCIGVRGGVMGALGSEASGLDISGSEVILNGKQRGDVTRV